MIEGQRGFYQLLQKTMVLLALGQLFYRPSHAFRSHILGRYVSKSIPSSRLNMPYIKSCGARFSALPKSAAAVHSAFGHSSIQKPEHIFGLRGGRLSEVTRMASSSAVEVEQEKKGPVEKFRADYQRPAYWVPNVHLTFNIEEGTTQVTSELTVTRNTEHQEGLPLELDGEDLELLSINIDGVELTPDQYLRPEGEKGGVVIPFKFLPEKDSFKVTSTTKVAPEENTSLSGLYRSSGMWCTQCEAEGFRRITLFPDRPDVMAKFSVRIEAPENFPVMLSNGNLLSSGSLGNGRSFAEWEDPFPKPSYLFALVVGDLGKIDDKFTTKSGREVTLQVFSEKDNVDKLNYAMESLKKSMKWDEDVYGLEYDLDLFNIVAVNDFNMGAMENKGLNIFNTAYVLAKPETATDGDYRAIEGVIGHEYFHNWSGNRVTCRDWFQLTLKEGLTVFRDQCFSGDMGSAAVKRIEDVRILRQAQFPEDSAGMAHPIRPESYIAMDNFYTVTVYNKGAEVIRMYQTLLGEEGFQKGMKLYWERHDGQAVSCDDFRAAMADANGVDLTQFENWYLQAGTPTVKASGEYNAEAQTYTLTMEQTTPPTPKQSTKEPFHIPVVTGLLGPDGKEMVPSQVLELTQEKQTFVLEGVTAEPVVSILRGFSAPVKMEFPHTDEDLAFLMAHDTDSFNRWEAGQKLMTKFLLELTSDLPEGKPAKDATIELPATLKSAIGTIISQRDMDKSLQAYAITLPAEGTLQQEMEVADPVKLRTARGLVIKAIAAAYKPELEALYKELAADPEKPYTPSKEEYGRRSLRNTVLRYLSANHKEDTEAVAKLCFAQFEGADCMTDKLAALGCLVDIDSPRRAEALEKFYEAANGDALVLNKWFSIQASADREDILEEVRSLMKHPDFTLKNPNRLRSVINVFATNLPYFHAEDGSGYNFIGDCILEIDQLNPQVASRLCRSLSLWKRYNENRQTLMKSVLQRVVDTEGVSKDTYEIAFKSLQ